MKAKDVRNEFLTFFEKQKKFPHTLVQSSSLVPANDRSVLFSIAGMQQFKPYFLGDPLVAKKELGQPRATSVQKCFRVTDIDEIGDATHLTFFEMLGNFSFNDYFKDQAISFAVEFLTKKLHLDATDMWVTYFGGDSIHNIPADLEAMELWKKAGIPEERIIARGLEDNFWGPPGATGPCGPSSEIYYPYPDKKLNAFDESSLIEIWNIVFMQYEKSKTGKFSELPTKNIDTGMGLERISVIVEQKPSIFETSIMSSLIEEIQSDPAFSANKETPIGTRIRIAADHLRSSIFLLSDDVVFGKKEQQAVLRRIFRKALDQYEQRHANLEKVLNAVVKQYRTTYPDLHKKQAHILSQMLEEQEMYHAVRERKVEHYLKKIRPQNSITSQIEPLRGPSSRTLSPQEAFTLLTTYGFSLEQLKNEGYSFDTTEIAKLTQKHKETSKQGSQKKFGGHGLDLVHSAEISAEERKKITRLHTATHLLHAVLRRILGDTVTQQGSDINTERLRFDFSFPRKLTDEEKKQIESSINYAITQNFAITREVVPLQQAIKSGALAFFREKYPDPVTVYSVVDSKTSDVFSRELCGGPHVERTGEIGKLTIVSEKSIAQGIRRIKAILS